MCVNVTSKSFNVAKPGLARCTVMLGALFCLGWLAASPISAQGLVYVDADDTVNLFPGPAYQNLSDVLNDQSFINTDNKWGWFGGAGVNSTVYRAGDGAISGSTYETAGEMIQRISGLAPGSYDIYVAYWTDTDNEDWNIAGGLTSGEQIVYNFQGPNSFFPTATKGTFASSVAWTTAPGKFLDGPVTDPEDRSLLIGKVGTASPVGGVIDVFINDPVGQTSPGRRSWFDGVAYVPTGTELFVTATVDRDTGKIAIENNTPVDFTVKSYSISSPFGSLDATEWNTIAPGNNGADPDPWTITAPASPGTTPFATSLAEQEIAGGSGGATLAANTGEFDLGENVWVRTPFQDITISLTLADGTVVSPLISYTGDALKPGDFDGDGDVTMSDYAILSANMHNTNISTLTFANAYLLGDMTGNRRINYEDFEDFVFAFDAQNGGAGAFARMSGVPEPASASLLVAGIVGLLTFRGRGRRERAPSAPAVSRKPASVNHWTLLVAALAVVACNSHAFAVGVTGWAMDTTFGRPNNPVLTGENTSSPTLGDGTLNNAQDTAIYASIPEVSLTDGQQVTLTGSANLIGIASTHGVFRWGIFYENEPPQDADTFGWRGFLNENSNLQNNGNLNSKVPGEYTFASTVGTPARAVTLDASRDREFDQFVAGTYDFTMTIGRFGNEVYVDSSLSSAAGFLQKSRYATESDPGRITFNYNRVGLLAGNVLTADQVLFSNIDVSTSEIETLTLQVTTSGPSAGTTKIVNSLGAAVDLNYYEISSATGGLSLSGWDRLDPDTNVVGPGWNAAGGSSGLVISETNVAGALFNNNAELNLGTAFDPLSAQNLRFFYGLTDGTFVRGQVEYVAGGLDGDHNSDGAVNAADYVLWRKNPSAYGGPGGYTLWRQNYGASLPGAGGGAVPEPTTMTFLILAVVGALATCHRR